MQETNLKVVVPMNKRRQASTLISFGRHEMLMTTTTMILIDDGMSSLVSVVVIHSYKLTVVSTTHVTCQL